MEQKPHEVYSERTIWSPRFKAWKKFAVKKPRLPTPVDKDNWVNTFLGRPPAFTQVGGTYLDSACRSLMNFTDQFESTKNLQDLVLICGPAGSGKSMLSQLFIQELLYRMELPFTIAQKWCLYISCRDYNSRNFHEIFKLIKDHMEAPQDKSIKVPLKLILLEDADTIPATHQNTLKTVMDKNSLKIKWIFTANEPRKFIQYLQTKGVQLKLKSPNEKEALLITLNICHRFKIGYDREGIKTIFDICKESSEGLYSLSAIVNLIQTTFIKTHYVSEENVFKAAKKKPPPTVVGPYAPIEPFQRCRICTLYPPCKHLTQDMLIEQGQARRKAYPEYLGENRPVCAEFARTGRCTVFNTHKRCTLAHPKQRAKVLLPVIRCPNCTITWPCQHCAYSKNRNALLDVITEIERRIELIQLINVPEPPAHLIIHLVEEFDEWEMTLSAIAKFYLTTEKRAVLTEVITWINDEHCVVADEYEWKRTHITRTFAELFTTPLLKDRRPALRSRHSRTAEHAALGLDDDASIASSSVAGRSVASAKSGTKSIDSV